MNQNEQNFQKGCRKIGCQKSKIKVTLCALKYRYKRCPSCPSQDKPVNRHPVWTSTGTKRRTSRRSKFIRWSSRHRIIKVNKLY
ncbi:unnamed protein product [Nesidiocoris tenuis]|uniref:Uncharacterized protein n=1 Tax=Nesidiocoris tenuis TaxID=355587 RepID=A0A6H5GTL3_9HEMI|nr:unnamed protein product [Nesidiocoris tenuis]